MKLLRLILSRLGGQQGSAVGKESRDRFRDIGVHSCTYKRGRKRNDAERTGGNGEEGKAVAGAEENGERRKEATKMKGRSVHCTEATLHLASSSK